jgi:histidine triad (HIT) family protein
LAFNDINPQAPIHILVIPKECYSSFETTPNQLFTKASEFIKEVTKKLGIDKSGYRLITNIGDNGGQEVKHLHFHIISGAKLKWGNFI